MNKSTFFFLCLTALILSSCTTTRNLPEGEQLYTGIKRVDYIDHVDKLRKKYSRDSVGVITSIADAVKSVNDLMNNNSMARTMRQLGGGGKMSTKEENRLFQKILKAQEKADGEAFSTAQTEVEAVLSCPPNNSFFGSSYYRTPLPIGLWFYNGLVNKNGVLNKWFYKNFASSPVLISTVNPDTRVKVAENTLHNYGYFRGHVKYETITQRNPRKAKISYSITTNALYRLDSIAYVGFPAQADSLIRVTSYASLLKKGDPFSVVNLSGEQTRLESLFRDNGYYFYGASDATYLADTTAVAHRVQLQMKPKDNATGPAKRRWYMGRIYIDIHRTEGDSLTTHWQRGPYSIAYNGDKIPMRQGVWFRNIHHRRGQLYRLSDQKLTSEKLSALNVLGQMEMNYVPRDTSALCDTLDLHLNTVMDKWYDGDFEMNVTAKSNDLLGPGLAFGLAKRNAFRGAEKVSFKIFGSYEWQTNNRQTESNGLFNSYEVGTKLSFDFPRVIFPGVTRRTFRFPATTTFSLDADWMNRAGYFNMLTFSLGATYKWTPNSASHHELTLFDLEYDRLVNRTHTFDSIMAANPALYVSMRDQFVPSIQYAYTYSSAAGHRNPVWWQTVVKEAGNVTSALYSLAGKKMSETGKTLFSNPFAQFFKLTSEMHVTYRITRQVKLATRFMGGIVYAYGNSTVAPYSDQFFVGGANSVRGFTVRSIGPGRFRSDKSKYAYMDQTGDLKLEANAELRFPLFGSLRGALFVDAGNVWLIRKDESRPEGRFRLSRLPQSLALGTGCGLRYDMEFLVLRLDLGIGLHDPSSTSGGYFNIPRFKDAMSLHFAIGYPF